MKKYLLLLSFLTNHLYAQVLNSPFSKTYTGIGTYSLSFTTPFSFTSNQAALAQTAKPGAAIYSERPYLLKELTVCLGVAVTSISSGAIGISLNYYGNNDYNQSQLGLAYGKKLSDKIDFGVQFNYHRINVPAYDKTTAINVEIGTIIHVSEKLHAGIHIANPLGKSETRRGEQLAYANTFGIGYEASENLLLQMEISKEEHKPIKVNSSIQYNFKEQLYIRTGIVTDTGNLFFGAGWQWKQIRIDISSSYHSILGISPTLMIIIKHI